MKNYIRKKRTRVLANIMILGLILSPIQISYAMETEESESYETISGNYLEETEGFLDLSDESSFNYDIPKTRASSSMVCTVSAKSIKLSSSSFSKSSGTIKVSGIVSNTAKIGIVDSSGYTRSVTANGSFTHSFSITKSSTYRVYVENTNGTSITVNASINY